ncbi:hypothetical protein FSP39_023031 [Pinctada imbricata]|uniref:Farnesoic acid O-methyl transferase domain-containing protein n=1 Tax=Pinctada imbricata TaxID=66713 RepID=A0AA88Y9M9_PINIB|nr:hypothetical protein FSP39_023031 [Pinctada imbricata]
MTASKRDSHAVMRLERMFNSEIDPARVHHVCGGPYKGIYINKAAKDLQDVEPAEGRLEFLAYLVNEEQNNESLQDYWTLRFWFRGKADGVVKKKTFTDYFQELMNPSSFPKNYIGFIKKALVLLRVYPVIKRVELEVQQTEEESPEDSLPPIKSFTSVFTPALYDPMMVPEIPISNKTFITFMVKAAGDAHLALSAVYGDVDRKTYEIVIGADGNTKSVIRYGAGGTVVAEAITMNIISVKEFRYFWISWADHKVEVGRGAKYGHGRFLHWPVPANRQFNVNCLSVSTDTASRGQWEFAELLEDAYPNAMKTPDLMRHCKVKPSDAMTALVFLADLQKRGLVKEVEEGFWLRIQSGGEQDTTHEVKVVKNLPQLTGKEQPTIAIITTLYCEKLAVDAMIEEKTTYVRHKTEGESQVYTVGKIGKFNVVSTKVSRQQGKEEEIRIAAENTVTRLLGTFSKVDHVILTGVGGSVPDYRDGSKHARLGDVVVSVATVTSGPIYAHCEKVEKTDNAQGYDFKTKEWCSKFSELQDVAISIKQLVERDKNGVKPWDKYIEEGKYALKAEDSSFNRPPLKTDRLFYTKQNGTVIEVEHPKPAAGYKEGECNVHHGVIGSGKIIHNTDRLKFPFAQKYGIRALDINIDAILNSLEGNRNESFLIIRGIADYQDGSRNKWQPYASVTAAAYMKSLITAMS